MPSGFRVSVGIYQPFSFVSAGWRHRRLIAQLAWRKTQERYRGSVLGLLWAILQPLMMLGVYTFVFSIAFQARWDSEIEHRGQFALFLFSGLILYGVFAECVNEAPRVILANRTYVKHLIFPTEILAWVSVLAALFNLLVSLSLLVVFYLVIQGSPPITWLHLPLLLAPLLLLTLGATWLLGSLGVFLRDLSQVVGVFTTALLFMSPIFYPASRIPESIRGYFDLNPLVGILEMSKASLFYGAPMDWMLLAQLTVGAWIAAWLGYVWFMKTKSGMVDVI